MNFRFATLAVLSATAMLAAKPKFNVSGEAAADVGVYFDTDFDYSTAANHSIAFTLGTELDEGISLDVSLLAQSTYKAMVDSQEVRLPSSIRHPEKAALLSDEDALYPTLALDGITLSWEFIEGGKFLFGDLGYSHGGTSYYMYKDAGEYAAVVPETYIRGFGFEGGGAKVYLGAGSASEYGVMTYLSYTIPLIERPSKEMLSITPMFDFYMTGKPRAHRHTLGLDAEYSRTMNETNFSTKASLGLIPYKNEHTYSVLLEPSVGRGMFMLGATAFHAFLAHEDSPVEEQIYFPSQQFLIIEPGLIFHPRFALGLPVEYHNPSVDVQDDETWRFVPSFYLYPSDGMDVTFWLGINNPYMTKYTWSFGTSAEFTF